MYFAASREDALAFETKNHGHRYTHLLTCELEDMREEDFLDLIAEPNQIVRQRSPGQSMRDAVRDLCRKNKKKGVIWQSPSSETSSGWKEICLLSDNIPMAVLIIDAEAL